MKLSAAVQWLIGGLLLLLVTTGIVWLLAENCAETLCLPAVAAWPEPYVWQAWAMRLHGALAYVFVFVAGLLFAMHMRPAWRVGRNRPTGVAMASLLLLLAASGYGLYYVTGDDFRAVTEWMHWVTGFTLPLLLLLHRRIGIQGTNDSR